MQEQGEGVVGVGAAAALGERVFDGWATFGVVT